MSWKIHIKISSYGCMKKHQRHALPLIQEILRGKGFQEFSLAFLSWDSSKIFANRTKTALIVPWRALCVNGRKAGVIILRVTISKMFQNRKKRIGSNIMKLVKTLWTYAMKKKQISIYHGSYSLEFSPGVKRQRSLQIISANSKLTLCVT